MSAGMSKREALSIIADELAAHAIIAAVRSLEADPPVIGEAMTRASRKVVAGKLRRIADMQVPPPYLCERAHEALADEPVLAARLAQAVDVSPKMARTCWRDLARHAHGLLAAACEGTARTPEWWLAEAPRLDELAPRPCDPLPRVTHRIADILAIGRPRCAHLAEITYYAYRQAGDLK